MPDPIFERYKEALKAGHVAVLRGRPEEAIAHYREAAEIAPERSLPHSSLGGVLLHQGRLDEALTAYARALGRAPRDEGALSGRAEALVTAGRPDEAAEVLERLADVMASTARLPEALETLQRAAALKTTRARRRRIAELEATLAVGPKKARRRLPSRVEAISRPRPRRTRAGAVQPEPAAAAEPLDQPVAPPNAETLAASAEGAAAEGRAADAVEAYIAASAAYAARGEVGAAFDACERGLELAPGDPGIHVQLARLYLGRGWRDRAAEKLILLDHLLAIDGDEAARSTVAAFARATLPDEPRLASMGATDHRTWPGPD